MYVDANVLSPSTAPDFSQCFGVLVRWPDDPQEQLLMFKLLGEESLKNDTIQELAKMMASVNCSTDPVSSFSLTTFN